MPMGEQADQNGYNEQSFMRNFEPFPGIKTLEMICERLRCGEWKVLPANRRADTFSRIEKGSLGFIEKGW